MVRIIALFCGKRKEAVEKNTDRDGGRHARNLYKIEEFDETKDEIKVTLKKVKPEERKKKIREIVEKLADSFEPEKLLEDVLQDEPNTSLDDLYERVVTNEGEVEPKEGCFYLSIGGKQGRRRDLYLRD